MGEKYRSISYERFDNVMFLAGFSIKCHSHCPYILTDPKKCHVSDETCASLLSQCYGYLIMLAILIIERHCLQFMVPNSIQKPETGWEGHQQMSYVDLRHEDSQLKGDDDDDFGAIAKARTSKIYGIQGEAPTISRGHGRSQVEQRTQVIYKIKDENGYETIKKKVNFISTLNLIKVLVEALISMLILMLAFYKITAISFIYVLFIFIVSFFGKTNKTAVLNIMLIICIWIQYLLVLSNISPIISPEAVPRTLTN